MSDLTPVPSCSTDTTCEAPDDSATGLALAIYDMVTNCLKALTGDGIPVSDGTSVANKDGSALRPINLPSLQVIAPGSSFPFVLIQQMAGKIMRLRGATGATPKVLISSNGSFALGDVPRVICYPASEICDCPGDYFATWTISGSNLCIGRVAKSDLAGVDIWDDSNTVDIQGAGTAGDHYSANVKVSADDGNILQIRDDGLYVACCDYGLSGLE